ncbi:MAG: DUF2959 domain-containing protein [Pseudomonadota bacterium]
MTRTTSGWPENGILLRTVLSLLPMLLGRRNVWVGIIAAVAVYVFAGERLGLAGSGGLGLPSLGIDHLWSEPRDILVDRVEDARDAQEETVEEFASALEKFKAITNFQGGDLEAKYNTLSDAFERSEAAAADVSSRIDRVTDATNRLLSEWKEELGDYHDATFRARAEAQFDETRERASQLIAAMRKAESKTKPVLDAFRDQVLYIKHNLNMQAIASLDEEAATIENDVSNLVREMEASIEEANTFINSLLQGTG